MPKFENKYNISNIVITRKLHNFCTIGQDSFTNNLEIEIVPDRVIPDYIEVDNMIERYEDLEVVIEEVIYKILESIKTEYEPKYIRVTSYVDDAKHSTVEVTSEYTK